MRSVGTHAADAADLSRGGRNADAWDGLGPGAAWSGLLTLGIDPDSVTETIHRQIKVITATTLLFLIVASATLAQALAMGFQHEAIMIVGSILIGVANLEILRRTRRPILSGHIAIAILYTLIGVAATTAGGFYHPSFAWTYVIPLAAAIVVGTRGAVFWTGATVLLNVGYWAVPELGIDLSLPMSEPAHRVSALADRILTISAVSILGLCFGTTYRRAQNRLTEEKRYLQVTVSGALAANQSRSLVEAMASAADRIRALLRWQTGQVLEVEADGSLSVVHTVTESKPLETRPTVRDDARLRQIADQAVVSAIELGTPQIIALPTDSGPLSQLLFPQPADLIVVVPVKRERSKHGALRFIGTTRALDFQHGTIRRVFAHVAAQLEQVATRADLHAQVRQEQKMAAVGKLAAGMAHEINNPMAFVRSNLNLVYQDLQSASKDAPPDFDEMQAAVAESLEGVERAVGIVRDVVAFSREGDVDSSTWTRIDLDEIVVDSVRVATADIGTQVPVGVTCDSRSRVTCAPNAIRQVCVNLVLNAVQAAGPTGRVEVSTTIDDEFAVISVEDSGPGVPPYDRERIFEPFFTTKEIGRGTGLGLSVSFEIIASHRGTLSVHDSSLGGALFEVRLRHDCD